MFIPLNIIFAKNNIHEKLITLSLVLLSAMYAQAQTPYPGGIPNCVARYDFNSTTSGAVSSLADVSGNNNNSSSVFNLTTTTDFRGRANKAMLFNGTNSTVTVPDASILNPGSQISMVALVRFDRFLPGPLPGYIDRSERQGHI